MPFHLTHTDEGFFAETNTYGWQFAILVNIDMTPVNNVQVTKDKGFSGGSVVKNPPAKQETQVQSLGWEDPLEKEMATHSSILAWEISCTEELAGYSPWGRKRVGHDLAIKQQLQKMYYYTSGQEVVRISKLSLHYRSILHSCFQPHSSPSCEGIRAHPTGALVRNIWPFITQESKTQTFKKYFCQ